MEALTIESHLLNVLGFCLLSTLQMMFAEAGALSNAWGQAGWCNDFVIICFWLFCNSHYSYHFMAILLKQWLTLSSY